MGTPFTMCEFVQTIFTPLPDLSIRYPQEEAVTPLSTGVAEARASRPLAAQDSTIPSIASRSWRLRYRLMFAKSPTSADTIRAILTGSEGPGVQALLESRERDRTGVAVDLNAQVLL